MHALITWIILAVLAFAAGWGFMGCLQQCRAGRRAKRLRKRLRDDTYRA